MPQSLDKALSLLSKGTLRMQSLVRLYSPCLCRWHGQSPEPSTMPRCCYTKQEPRGTREARALVRQQHCLPTFHRMFWKEILPQSASPLSIQKHPNCFTKLDCSRVVPLTENMASQPGKGRNKHVPNSHVQGHVFKAALPLPAKWLEQQHRASQSKTGVLKEEVYV